MAVEYRILCDDCGIVIGTSMTSAKAARADAQLNRSANSGGGQDRCKVCRIAATQLTNEDRERAATRHHSTPGAS